MRKVKKCSIRELEKIWMEYGWVCFKKFEDYVVEVRKVEADLQNGEISFHQLKEENDRKIDETELLSESNESA